MIYQEEDGDWVEFEGLAVKEEPAAVPELPPEVHNTRPVDAERAMAAVRAMCG